MATPRRRRRWSVDLSDQASVAEEAGAAALVIAALGLVALAAARVAGAHPKGALFVAALALAGAGVVALLASLGTSSVRNARRTVWSARADAGRPGVLLFLLEAVGGRTDPETAVRRLGPVRCLVRRGGAGGGGDSGSSGRDQLPEGRPGTPHESWTEQLEQERAGARGAAGAGTGTGPREPPAAAPAGEPPARADPSFEAPDERVSRVGGVLMTRFHAAFFAGAPEPWAGLYELTWEERHADGSWGLLASWSGEVAYQPTSDTA